MARNLSTEQAQARNGALYSRKLAILHQASIGVVLCRTREPFRAITTLRNFAYGERMGFKVWTITHGWTSYEAGSENQRSDDVLDPLKALKSITAEDTAGLYVMMYPHKPLAQNIGMLQLLKEYCHSFPTSRRRLVLITPPGWEIPQELEDDLVVLDFDSPSYAELGGCYDELIASISDAKRPKFSEEQVDRILAAGAGMTMHEFENAVSRALAELRAYLPNADVEKFVQIVSAVKTEVVKRSEVLEMMEPGRIEDIGGLENLKSWATKRARCFSQTARDAGIEPPKGIALIGPPGTGKSASAKAIASLLGLPLIKFDVSRVFNSLVGSSEARVRGALKLVDAMAPCVLMIDEADKAFAGQAGGQGGGDSGVGMRVLGAILTWMQETKAPVFTVVTANRTQGLPAEFLRRGRLDEVFSVTVPHAGERMEILKIHLNKRGQTPESIGNLSAAVARSEGYVPAEIEAAVKDAIIESYTQQIPMTGDLIAEQLQYMVPLSEAFREQFDAMRVWAEQNARPASIPEGETKETVRAGAKRERTPRSTGTKLGGGRRLAGLDKFASNDEDE